MTGQVIAFDPPGTIGLPAGEAVVLLRFDEPATELRPADAAGTLGDLAPGAGMVMPEVVDAATGRGRRFAVDGGVAANGLVGVDLDSGASLFTRDVTIQVICSWDMDAQADAGTPGTIIQRGLAYSFALEVYDLPTRQARLGSSVLFVMPVGYTMLTMTRRWVSPELAVWRYYLGDLLLGEERAAPSIAGATIDPVYIGFAADGGTDPFVGVIDELLILDHEITREEVEATWLRITKWQPLGYQLLREMYDPGFPLPNDPASDVQLEMRMWGHALGYAAAQGENFRANFLLSRAYGSVLADWEEVVRAPPAPPNDIDTRRSRVLSLLRQRRGSSIPGLRDALAPVVGVDVSELEFLAFDNTIHDDFSAGIRSERWEGAPDLEASWGHDPGQSECYPVASGGDYTFDGDATRLWLTLTTDVQGDGLDAHIVARPAFVTPQSGAEIGVYFGNFPHNNYLLLGLLDTGGVYTVVTESFVDGVSDGPVTQATLGASPENLWLHLWQVEPGSWQAAWSTTSAIAGYTLAELPITHPTLADLGGLYLRSQGAIAGCEATFTDVVLRAPHGDRPFAAYVFRDAGFGGLTDVEGGHVLISAIKHAFIDGTLITSKSFLCDDGGSLCDRGPLGGF